MWKRLDDLSLSDRHANVSLEAVGLWAYLMAHTDIKGRFHADARIIKAKCTTFRENLRLDQIEKLMAELFQAGLLHRYDVGGKPYFVLHRCAKYNPPGALRYRSATFAPPPDSICKCLLEVVEEEVQPQESGGLPPPVTVPLPLREPLPLNGRDEAIRGVAERIIHQRKTPSKELTVYKYVRALFARGLGQKVESWSFNSRNDGKDVICMQEEIAPRNGAPTQAPAIRTNAPVAKSDQQRNCKKCGGSGMVVVEVEHERYGKSTAAHPCDCVKPKEATA